jgi:hypothetical protein
VRAVIAFKVGNDAESIVNAGQYLSDQSQMSVLTGRIFAGHNAAIQRKAQIAQARANQAAADAQQECQRNQANPRSRNASAAGRSRASLVRARPRRSGIRVGLATPAGPGCQL